MLRIEDTDVARSTQASVEQILHSMRWLGLDYDEGPVYQMQRLDRYAAVVDSMLVAGSAYRCYATPAELEAMREGQRARGEKTLYDGRWRPEPGKVLPPIPAGVDPVVRFRNPQQGVVTWDDMVKGPITISNHEIDDLVIVRADGVPTYNFAVVVDDWDMAISHVFRGDEHVNNTPWQINIFRALGAPLPVFAHVPVILGDDGQKLSKRRGAVSVTAYEDGGYLPEAMLNYLARLGWSHGDAELFTREHARRLVRCAAPVEEPRAVGPGQARLGQRPLPEGARRRVAARATPGSNCSSAASSLAATRRCCAAALSSRTAATPAPSSPNGSRRFSRPRFRNRQRDLAMHVTELVRPALRTLRDKLAVVGWNKAEIAAAIKATLAAHALKMPQLAPAVRVLVCGRAQTPSLDAVLEAIRPIGRPASSAGRVSLAIIVLVFDGGIAQLGERLHGMQEVSGSIPLTSTTKR